MLSTEKFEGYSSCRLREGGPPYPLVLGFAGVRSVGVYPHAFNKTKRDFMKPDWINEINRVEPLKTGEVLVIETQAYPCTPRGFEAALADLEAITALRE